MWAGWGNDARRNARAMPRRTDDLISFTLGDLAPARTKTPKSPEETADSANGGAVADSVETPAPDNATEATSTPVETGQGSVAPSEETDGYVDVRPIGTTQGLRELAQLYKKCGGELGALERKVHMMLWPLALHFGLYWVKRGRESKRPPLVAAFWARSLAEAPLTLGHLYPPALFKGLLAGDMFEFGGMVIDSSYRREAADAGDAGDDPAVPVFAPARAGDRHAGRIAARALQAARAQDRRHAPDRASTRRGSSRLSDVRSVQGTAGPFFM